MGDGIENLDRYDTDEYPLRPVVAAWCRVLRRALKEKRKEFQDDADDCMIFFNGVKDDFWRGSWAQGKSGYLGKNKQVPEPDFQMILMKIAEAVQIFGPSLYAQNPVVEVNAVQPTQVPPEVLGIDVSQPNYGAMIYQSMMQADSTRYETNKAASTTLAQIINYQMRECDAKGHSRRCIDECLIKGESVAWTELFTPPGSDRSMVMSSYDSVDNLLKDPDATIDEGIMWKARKRVMPYWEAEDKFKLKRGTLKDYAAHESMFRQESADEDAGKKKRIPGKTNDLIVFWEVYSKMGMGDLLHGVSDDLVGKFDKFGKYVYLAISDCCPYPLNLPQDDDLSDDDAFVRAQWPIPFWADVKSSGWPCTELAFHKVPGKIWGMSHFKPGMGELKWLTWAMSFLANKVRTSCGTLIGVRKAAGDDLKAALKSGEDNKIVQIESSLGDDIRKLVSYIEQPPFHGDIYKVIAAVMDLWDKRVGLTDLAYGAITTQDRSATTTEIRQENASVRVNDMASLVESWSADKARKEAMAVRWLLTPEDVRPMVNSDLATMVFTNHLMSMDIEAVVREFHYTVAAGATRMLNRQVKMANFNDFAQKFAPVMQAMLQGGIVEPINAFMQEWGKLSDTDVSAWMIPPPPPPQEPPPDPKIMAEVQKIQLEAQIEQQRFELEKEKHAMELQVKALELQMKQQEQTQKIAFEREKAQTDIQLAAVKAQAEGQIAQQKVQTEAAIATQKAQTEMGVAHAKAQSDIGVSRAKAQSDMASKAAKTQSDVENSKVKAKAQAANAKKSSKATKTPQKGE